VPIASTHLDLGCGKSGRVKRGSDCSASDAEIRYTKIPGQSAQADSLDCYLCYHSSTDLKGMIRS